MKNKKKALLLASIASLGILCGCGKVKTIEVDDETYVESNGEYIRLDIEPKVYEPGTHVIQYVHNIHDGNHDYYKRKHLKEGFNNIIFTPEIPEGYKIVGTTSYSNNDGYDYFIIYIMVNDKTVEVEGVFDAETNSIIYNDPGKVIEEKALELGD